MAYLLFPGRHVANTKFQESYLRRLVYPVSGEKPVEMLGPSIGDLDSIVFAITSSNQQDSRFNPISYTERTVGVDRFRRDLEEILPSSIGYHMVGIPHFDHSDR